MAFAGAALRAALRPARALGVASAARQTVAQLRPAQALTRPPPLVSLRQLSGSSSSSSASTPAANAGASAQPRSSGALLATVLLASAAGGVALLGRPHDNEPASDPAAGSAEASAQSTAPAADSSALGSWNNYDDENPVLAYIYRARDRISDVYQSYFHSEPENLLPPPLPPQYRASDYTIVLDLEDTLVHSEWTHQHGWRTIKRPGLDFFLQYLATNLFEVVVFADRNIHDVIGIMDAMDPQQYVLYRLGKNSTRVVNGHHVKDLDRLNRDVRKVIIVDDNPRNFQLHPNNGIKIKKFDGNPDDTALIELIPFLQAIVVANVQDVREVISRYKDVDDVAKAYNEQNQRLAEAKQRQAEQSQKDKPSADGSSGGAASGKRGGLFGFFSS